MSLFDTFDPDSEELIKVSQQRSFREAEDFPEIVEELHLPCVSAGCGRPMHFTGKPGATWKNAEPTAALQ